MAQMPAGNGDPPALTDVADALERAGGRPEVASELFRLLVASLDEADSALRDARSQNDVNRLRDAAHRLHGATLYCGVPRLRLESRAVERLCTDDDDQREGLDDALERLLTTLETMRSAKDPTIDLGSA